MQNAAQTYQTNQVTTATPGELTLMLYNGALKYIKLAKGAMEKKDIVNTHNHTMRVQEILNELIVTLNRDYPISQQFLTMYEYMLNRLVEANMQKDVNMINEVEDLFIQFRDTWKEAMVLAKQQD